MQTEAIPATPQSLSPRISGTSLLEWRRDPYLAVAKNREWPPEPWSTPKGLSSKAVRRSSSHAPVSGYRTSVGITLHKCVAICYSRGHNRYPTRKGEAVPTGQMRPKVGPAAVQAAVDTITSALNAIVSGDDVERQTEVIDVAVNTALQTAIASAPPKVAGWDEPLTSTFGQILGANVRERRRQAGWTQEMLAESMSMAGCPWKRITCAEVEADSRRLSMEELLVLSALFAIPAIELMTPNDDAVLELPGAYLKPREVRELLVGQGGVVGEGGLGWRLAITAVGPGLRNERRPATDLWNRNPSAPPSQRGRSSTRGRQS